MVAARSRRVALVAGATGTLGAAIAERLAADGFDLALGFRRKRARAQALANRCASLGARALAFAADLERRGQARRLVRRSKSALGRLDAVVCSMGDLRTGPARSLGAADLRSLFSSNVEAAFSLAREALPLLRGRSGRIVFLGQAGAGNPKSRRRTAGYAAAKGALLLLARSLAREAAPLGITVNVVSPGAVAGARGEKPPLRAIPSGRYARPQEVAAAVSFLLSEEAGSVTGAEIPVSGGFGI